MIITQEKNKQFVHSHDFEEVKCTIDAEDMRYVASLLRNNYSNPALAVVREISANAIDANLEAGTTRPIEIKLPTALNPSFEVRDFGGGLSQEEIQARTPDDIPDLISEDVVSKQLREAALSEDDPKLRERLWEEYRNYNRF